MGRDIVSNPSPTSRTGGAEMKHAIALALVLGATPALAGENPWVCTEGREVCVDVRAIVCAKNICVFPGTLRNGTHCSYVVDCGRYLDSASCNGEPWSKLVPVPKDSLADSICAQIGGSE